jgi:hypothetical protein
MTQDRSLAQRENAEKTKDPLNQLGRTTGRNCIPIYTVLY